MFPCVTIALRRAGICPTVHPAPALSADESRTLERYAAALLVFEGLEERHGADKVRRWVAEITSASGGVSKEMLAASIKTHFGEDMAVLLRD